jgi:16S rRNA (cytosine1402-N4)-methyltransferase
MTTQTPATLPHFTVLLDATVKGINLQEGDIAIDCTVGGGGHTEAILGKVGEAGFVLGLDRDQSALELAKERLLTAKNLTLRNAVFSDIRRVTDELGITGKVAGICADIGVSSMHLDQPQRGFSFRFDGPLDMRMDQTSEVTAAEIVNTWEEHELADLFYHFGEEPKARVLAKRIIERRNETPFARTAEFAEFVKVSLKYPSHSKKHPATKAFQALRIAVNGELDELAKLIADSLAILKSGGRLGIITFHSLEDRIVKHAFQRLAGTRDRPVIDRDVPLRDSDFKSSAVILGRIIKPFPILPTDEEISENPRSRSAKLRIIEKV